MGAVIAVVAVALIAAAVVIYLRGRNREQAQVGGGGQGALGGGGASTRRMDEVPGSGVKSLKPSDVVQYEGRDYIIEGTITFNEDGFVWNEHLLKADDDKFWLSVEDDEGDLEVVLWRRAAGAELEPGPKSLTYEGVTYKKDEQGSANFTAVGSTGTGPSGHAQYADYENGQQRLSFERYGNDAGWEINVGAVISEFALDIYPGRGL